MTGEPPSDAPVLAYAVITPAAAAAIVHVLDPHLRDLEARAYALAAGGDVGTGRQVLGGLRQLRESARQWRAHTAATSPRGSGEVPQPAGAAWSERPPDPGLTTREVAEILGLTARQVRNLARSDGSLISATSAPGGALVIDALSVEAEVERRRQPE